MYSVQTTCGYCGCGCNMYYTVENDDIIAVSPREDHPVSRGKMCAKGWQGHTFVRHRERLETPLIRNAEGVFEPASWKEAISFVARGLSGLAREHGPEKVGVLSSARCTNEENYLTARLARAALKTPNIDHCARL